MYSFSEQQPTKYPLDVTANGLPLDPDGVVPGADFCVGQYITFALGGIPGGVGSTDYRWSLGGLFVNTNIPSEFPNGSGYYTNEPAFLKLPSTWGWWVSGNFSPPDICSAFTDCTLIFYNGNPPIKVGVNGLFHMYRPNSDLTGTMTGEIRADAIYRNPQNTAVWLHFGGYGETFNIHGIEWTAHVTTPVSFAGEIAFTQLAEADNRRTRDDTANTKEKQTSNGAFLIDDGLGIQYGGPVGIDDNAATLFHSDSPGLMLSPSLVNPDLRNVSADDNFKLYLTYNPDTDNSIWVTLRSLTWRWNGSATKDTATGVWTLDPGSDKGVTPSVDDTVFSLWTNSVRSLSWTPE